MGTITIASVNPKKSGTTNRRKWTMYEVRAQDGKAFTTFDAEWMKHAGETVEATASERNRLGAFPARLAPNGNSAHQAPLPPAPETPDRFAVLNDKLDRALAELATIRRHFA